MLPSISQLKDAPLNPAARALLVSNAHRKKNALLNGDFQVWQAGTTFAAMATNDYMADNWKYTKSGAMVHTCNRSTDVPTVEEAGRKMLYSLQLDCTTADAAIGAAEFCNIQTYVEGYNFVNFAGVGLCHQFWHKHTKVGTYCVAYYNSAASRCFVREYTQAVSDKWELATVLIEASPSGGSWNYTTGVGLSVVFSLACGSNFHTIPGVWQTTTVIATANQVNACDDVANNFMLAGVQLEEGSIATEFDARTFADELAALQRYWYQTYAQGVAAGTIASVGACGFGMHNGNIGYNTATFAFPVSMRTVPTVIYYSPDTGASGNWRRNSGADVAVANGGITSADSVIVNNSGLVGVGELLYGHFTCNARF